MTKLEREYRWARAVNSLWIFKILLIQMVWIAEGFYFRWDGLLFVGVIWWYTWKLVQGIRDARKAFLDECKQNENIKAPSVSG